MNSKTTIPISEARKRIFEIAEEVQKPSTYYTFTENGRPKAVLMSAEEFESWKETLEVMQEFPDLADEIKEADAEYKSGNYITLDALMQRYGYVLKDAPKQKYETRGHNSKKGSKTTR